MWRGIAIGSCLVLLVVGVVSGQGQRSPATLDDLLRELRGLRADLNASVTATSKVQLVVGRMQVQEQRIAALSQDLAAVRTEANTSSRSKITSVTIASLEERLRSGAVIPERRAAFERELIEMNERLQREEQRANDLRYRENELLNMLVTEQGRWIDFSSRLDDLERALSR
jgi:hypothetical protein